MNRLEVRGISKYFVGLHALDDVSFRMSAGELVALIGPNGAGKSTLINVITGDQAPTAGEVIFSEQTISGLSPHAISVQGITRTYQAAEIFCSLTVLENVMVGAVRRTGIGIVESVLRLPSGARKLRELDHIATQALALVGLKPQASAIAGTLSAGQQRLLAIARALATGGNWIILDEPGAGLNQIEKQELAAVVRKLSAEGKTILFVEHDMSLVSELAKRVVVLDRGKLIADGSPSEVRQDKAVINAYLGVPQVVQGTDAVVSPLENPLLLEANHLVVRYGASAALKDMSFQVPARSIAAVVGPNGAGKSTLLKTLIRAVPITSGNFCIAGRSALPMSTRDMVNAGVALAPEGRELFASHTVLDNLLLGAYTRRSGILGRPRQLRSADMADQVFKLFPRLAERRDQLAGTLSGGEGQMLAIGRALMSEPRLLMLDEPSLGLAPIVVAEIFQALVRLREEGLTILLVEQNARAALEIADYGFVLETGKIVAQGEARLLLASPQIASAYLGGPTNAPLQLETLRKELDHA